MMNMSNFGDDSIKPNSSEISVKPILKYGSLRYFKSKRKQISILENGAHFKQINAHFDFFSKKFLVWNNKN